MLVQRSSAVQSLHARRSLAAQPRGHPVTPRPRLAQRKSIAWQEGFTAGNDEFEPDKTLLLPALTGVYLTDKAAGELGPVIAQTPTREALADIYLPSAFAQAQSKPTGAIIFGHAFVQPSKSYRSVISKLKADGWLVVAPRTDLFDIIGRDIGLKFDQGRADVKLQSTLQSALIIDMLRSHELLLESLEFKDKINDIVFVGHSLGGACSIIAAAKLKYDKIRGVAVMSPEVREMQKTPVNDDIWLLNGDADSIKAAMAFFRDEFPKDTQLAIISSKRDNISLPDDNKRLFVVATESRQDEDVALFSIDGNHFGYEDELDLPNQINLEGAQGSIGPIKFSLAPLTRPLKSLINIVNKTAVRLFEWVQYDAYWLSSVIGNSPQQTMENLKVLGHTLESMFAKKSLQTSIPGGVQVSVQPRAAEVKRVLVDEIRDNTTPNRLFDGLLWSYAGVQLLNSITAFKLLTDGGEFEKQLGLLILGTLSFNLAYENSILAAGRFIASQPGGLERLQELSKWRFLAHSGAPLAVVTGLNMAGRAGVEWAANPVYEGLIGLVILTIVTISSIRNSFFLEITPRYNRGVLRFGYNETAADFTRVIPVIVSTFTLIILGWQSYQKDDNLLPFFLGPLVAFILNAIPPAKDGEPLSSGKLPQFITGNGGEVALTLGLVATEVLLQMQGK